MKSSIILTIHNKDLLLAREVLPALWKFTNWQDTEIIFVLDGCTDSSEMVVEQFCRDHKISCKVVVTPDVFETKANNAGIRAASGEFVIILQDDIVVNEPNWNDRILEPFFAWNDVFAVSGNCAHNWEINPDPKMVPYTWSDLLVHIDHANKNTITILPKNTFAIRDSVNRGPLAINKKDLFEMGLFDDKAIYKQDMDDHDLMYRMHKKLGKVCGYYHIDTFSEPVWGGTRDENGNSKEWLMLAQKINMQLVYDRHKDVINTHQIENRVI